MNIQKVLLTIFFITSLASCVSTTDNQPKFLNVNLYYADERLEDAKELKVDLEEKGYSVQIIKEVAPKFSFSSFMYVAPSSKDSALKLRKSISKSLSEAVVIAYDNKKFPKNIAKVTLINTPRR